MSAKEEDESLLVINSLLMVKVVTVEVLVYIYLVPEELTN